MRYYKHRMTTAKLHITDASGSPLANRVFRVNEINSDFLFGCGAFDALPLTNEKKNDPYCENRMRKWLDVYNYGTLPFYWGQYEPIEGKPEFEKLMNAARFLHENGVKIKGHPLCWHTACADWLMKYDNKTILTKQLARINRDVTAFQGLIDIWDVINEVVIMPDFDKYDNAITRICKEYGRITLVKEVFDAAKAAAVSGFQRTVLRSKTDAMRSERTDL